MKIYQCYFSNDQLGLLDPSFIPYDNTTNERPELREYPILKGLYEKEKPGHWGMVSWRWKEKTHLDGKEYIKWIESNPGYDVYHFNPFMDSVALQMNPMTEGDRHHPGMRSYFDCLVNNLTEVFGQEFKYYHPDPGTYHDNNAGHHPFPINLFMYTSSYIGNKKFWDSWISFADACIEISSSVPELRKFMYEKPAHYGGQTLPHFSFIIERLVGLFLYTKGRNLRVLNFPYHHECFKSLYPTMHGEYLMKINERILDSDDPSLYKKFQKPQHIPRALR